MTSTGKRQTMVYFYRMRRELSQWNSNWFVFYFIDGDKTKQKKTKQRTKLQFTNFNHTKHREKHLRTFAYAMGASGAHKFTRFMSFSSGLFALAITLVAMNGHNCVCVFVYLWNFSFAFEYRSCNGIQVKMSPKR